MAAIDDLRNLVRLMDEACSSCGGSGERRAETAAAYVGRIRLALERKGFITAEEAVIRTERCESCGGSGREVR